MARGNHKPVESVELKVSIRADSATAEMIKSLFPSAKVRGGGCEIRLGGETPADVADMAEDMMQKLREVMGSPKGFKNPEGSQPQK